MKYAAVAIVFAFAGFAVAEDKEPPKPVPEKSEVEYKSDTKGALQVAGDTGDWFTVTRDGKNAGPAVPPKLGNTIELEPGAYEVAVNKTKRKITIVVGKKLVLQTGTLVVEGKDADWYAPFEGKERRVTDNPPAMGTPIALFPGTYSVVVRVGDKNETLTDKARVDPGKKTALKR